jgi:hypothetical protein
MSNTVRYIRCYFFDGKIHHNPWSPLYNGFYKKLDRKLGIFKYKNRNKSRDIYRGYGQVRKVFDMVTLINRVDDDYCEIYNTFRVCDFKDYKVPCHDRFEEL